jgi:hypothetical protein
MKKTYDLKFPARTYKTANGVEKTFWAAHGTLRVECPDGIDLTKFQFTVKMDSLPISKDYDGWFQCYEKKPFEERQGESRPGEYEDIKF